MFQSPERIHAFGNSYYHELTSRQSEKFQSPERIHAFGNLELRIRIKIISPGFNPQRGFMLLGTPATSQPEPTNQTGFNPQRGFMLLGTGAACTCS